MATNINDMPTFAASSYTSSTYDGAFNQQNALLTGVANYLGGQGGTGLATTSLTRPNYSDVTDVLETTTFELPDHRGRVRQQKEVSQMARRVVQVIVADTNENIPLDKCILHQGSQQLTDLTDQELYFGLNIKEMVDKHNEYRVTVRDKSVKDRVENLEPVKIRELKMIVVTIATL